MKKSMILLTLIIVIISCKPETGSISGNVYWKYNDYVGNKPDAGASIYLLSSDTTKQIKETTADVAGNYVIENIPIGKYLVLVRSNNTRSSSYDILEELKAINTKDYFNFDVTKIDEPLYESINEYHKKYLEQLVSDTPELSKRITQYTATQKIFMQLSDSLLKKIPMNGYFFRNHLGLYQGSPKLKFHSIEVKEGEQSKIVTDFGITYF